MGSTVRSSRLELRVAPDEKAVIDKAAALAGSSKADFIHDRRLFLPMGTVERLFAE